MEGKESYSDLDCPRKIRYQDRFLGIFSKCERTFILAGPPKSICSHIKRLRKLKVHHITSYEYKHDTWIGQLGTLKANKIHGIKCLHGDILNAPNKDYIGLELDFCGTIDKFLEHVKKFTSRNTIFTFSLRTGKKNPDSKSAGWYKEYTIRTFFKERNETIIHNVNSSGINESTIVTDNGIYTIVTYNDSGNAMIMFIKL